MNNLFFLGIVAITAIVTTAPSALSLDTFFDDSEGFNNSLNVNSTSTIVDEEGNFAPSPPAALGLSNIPRTGSINGSTFSYDIYDVNFSDNPPGSLTPGVAGGDIASLSTLRVETPVSQGGATGMADWGADSVGSLDSGSTRNAALFDFTTTPNSSGIGHFGLYLHDLESDPNFRLAELRLYQGGSLTHSQPIDWGAGFNGNGESHFLGIVAHNPSEFFDQVVIAVGDDNSAGGTGCGLPGCGYNEAWAADQFTFGQAHVPFDFSPGLGILIVGGLWATNKVREKLELGRLIREKLKFYSPNRIIQQLHRMHQGNFLSFQAQMLTNLQRTTGIRRSN